MASKKRVQPSSEEQLKGFTLTVFHEIDDLVRFAKGVKVFQDNADVTIQTVDDIAQRIKARISKYAEVIFVDKMGRTK